MLCAIITAGFETFASPTVFGKEGKGFDHSLGGSCKEFKVIKT